MLISPIIATFIFTGYDYPWDAIGANLLHTHAYRTPSGLFGVPLLNFFGWLLTGWVAFQIYALYQRKMVAYRAAQHPAFEVMPALLWLGIAASYFVRYLNSPDGMVSIGTRSFFIRDIYEASAAISIPAMVFPSILVLVAARWR